MSLEDILDALDEDGAEVDLEDGRTVRLRIKPDECDQPWFRDRSGRLRLNDEWYGEIADYDRGQRCTGSYGYPLRPDDMDGNAEVLRSYGIGDPIWWQPPKDGPKRGTPEFDAMRHALCELLEFGYSLVGLEMLEGQDAYRRPIVTDAAWRGGVEPMNYTAMKDMLRNDLLPDLLAEVGITEEGGEQ